MASRKSSILKPRKIREPLQDLNQLLPNNDDEETTMADTQKRRVSFASMNKVKEYEVAAECVALLNTPAYDERFPISSDSSQSSVTGVTHHDTTCHVDAANLDSRKSIQTTLKTFIPKQSAVIENVNFDEDIELTETIGRIYDTPMKSSGDSSMELTHVVSQNILSSVEPEVVCPLNLTKESNRTHNFSLNYSANVEILDKSKKSFSNSSRMETTEIIGENLITEERIPSDMLSMEITRVIAADSNRNDKSDGDTSSMEMTQVISEDNESIKSHSLCYETLDVEECEAENLCEEIVYNSTRTTTDELIPPRKSIFEISCPNSSMLNKWRTSRKSIFVSEQGLQVQNGNTSALSTDIEETDSVKFIKFASLEINDSAETTKGIISRTNNLNTPVADDANVNTFSLVSLVPNDVNEELTNRIKFTPEAQMHCQNQKKIDYCNLSVPLLNRPNEKTKLLNSSLQSFSQPDEKSDIATLQLLSQPDNKTKYNNSSMQLVSQPDDKTKCNNSSMQLLSQPDDKTKCNNSSMQLLSQPDDKTKCNNSSMHLATQPDEQTKYHSCSLQLVSQPEEKTKYHNSSMELLSQEIPTKNESDIPDEQKDQETDINFSVQFKSQERENKLNYRHLNMDVISQETVDKMENSADVQSNSSVNKTLSLTEERPTGHSFVLADTLSASKVESNEEEKHEECSTNREVISMISALTTDNIENEDPGKENELPSEITQKSISDHNSSRNDSNSPLTVGVNFSIFQKNKETRVEFSGTIDSNKKKKSISNVQVNIINNKVEKKGRNVKELRFSMPATTKMGPGSDDRPDFSATFTDFSTPIQEDVKSLTETEVKNHKESVEFNGGLLTSEPEKCTIVAGSKVLPNQINLQLSKPAVKRLSSDAFDEDNGQSSPKRPSLTNDFHDTKQAELASREDTDVKVTKSNLITENVTEVTQKRQSFVREEKSIVTVNNNGVVETRTKSTNLNISYERKSLISSSSSSSSPVNYEGMPTAAVGELQKSRSANSRTSAVFAAKSVSESEIKEHSPKIQNEIGSDESFILTHSTPFRQSHSANQSVNYEDEMSDYSLRNPSIMVMVGDSFSHYRSMDLGNENMSLSEACDSQEKESDIRNLIFATDNISKENFVAEWLQNKTGKSNVDSRMLDKLSASKDGQATVTISVNENVKEASGSTVSAKDVCVTSDANGQNQELTEQCGSVKGNDKVLPEVEDTIGKKVEISKTLVALHNRPTLSATSDQPRSASDEFNSTEHIPAENDERDKRVGLDSDESLEGEAVAITDSEVQSQLNDVEVHSGQKDSVIFTQQEESTNAKHLDFQNKVETNADEFKNVELQDSSAIENRMDTQQKTEAVVTTNPELVTSVFPVKKYEIHEIFLKQQSSNDLIPPSLVQEIETEDVFVKPESRNVLNDPAVIESPLQTIPVEVLEKQTEARFEILGDVHEKQNIASISLDRSTEAKKSTIAPLENLEPIDMEVEEIISHGNETQQIIETSIEENFEAVKSACKNKFPKDSTTQCIEFLTEKRRKMSPKCVKHELTNYTKSESPQISQTSRLPDIKSLGNVTDGLETDEGKQKRSDSLQRFVLEKIENNIDDEQDWCIKSTTDKKWVFSYLLGHMELAITFNEERTNFRSTLCYILPPKAKYNEIVKISVHYLVRKYEPKLNTLCRTVEDIPYLLKLINRDAIYARSFIIDIMKLGDSDGVKIKDGWATFYVSSYTQHLLLKVKVHIDKFENVSVNDVNVISIIGNADVSLIQRIFSESGRDYNFFSKFVNKMWSIFGSEKLNTQVVPMET